MHYFLQLITK